jgi:hypothetical protein
MSSQTPEERAVRVLKEFYSDTMDWRHAALLELVVSEIHAAVAEERERCASKLDARASRMERKAGGWRDWPDEAMLAKVETIRADAATIRERE